MARVQAPGARLSHDQQFGAFRQGSIAVDLIELHQSVGIALVALGDVPKAVSGAGDVDGHSWLLRCFFGCGKVLKACKITGSADPDLDGGAHVDFDLSAVDGVDPEVFDSGAREQIGSFQSRCVRGSVQCSPQWNLRFDDESPPVFIQSQDPDRDRSFDDDPAVLPTC